MGLQATKPKQKHILLKVDINGQDINTRVVWNIKHLLSSYTFTRASQPFRTEITTTSPQRVKLKE